MYIWLACIEYAKQKNRQTEIVKCYWYHTFDCMSSWTAKHCLHFLSAAFRAL